VYEIRHYHRGSKEAHGKTFSMAKNMSVERKGFTHGKHDYCEGFTREGVHTHGTNEVPLDA